MEKHSKKDHRYDDIIDMSHHVSRIHPQMPISDRAAQFAPFAALTGYDAAVRETARLTDDRIELDEYAKESLNRKLLMIQEELKNQPAVEITFFHPDAKKEGGSYIKANGNVRKIDLYEGQIRLVDGTVIPIADIVKLEGNLFTLPEE